MTEFHHILFPVDFSPLCQGTAPFVKDMARRYGAQVSLLHVTEVNAQVYGPMDVPTLVPINYEQFQRIDQEQMRAFSQRNFADLGPDLKVEEACQFGDPAHSIIDYAESSDVDLIMMPTHGYGRFRALLLGSIAAKVLHDAKCPVWTGVHLEEPPSLEHLKMRSILCAVDLKKESARVVKFALAVASAYRSSVQLVHTVPSRETRPEEYFDEKLHQALIEAARSELVDLQKESGAGAEEIWVEAGSVSKKVRSAALQFGADLIVIGRGLLDAPFGRLRTNAYAIIRDAPCPVLSV
ncbi:MAG: universal stress protein [Acidobacteriota bacterium]|nr:universal stress protein [Acidobacteriota bacterium]